MSDAVNNAPIFGATAPSTRGAEYEFSDSDNEVFRGLAVAMRTVGLGAALGGVLALLASLVGLFHAGPVGFPTALLQSCLGAASLVTGV